MTPTATNPENSMAEALPDRIDPGTVGFVFATTGRKYTTLARRAARAMRLVMPDVEIDLFTDDAELEDEVFSQIHRLDHGWFRPKMEAMRSSRFERTIMLDADLIIVADITEVFQVLDHYDIAGCPGASRAADMIPVEPGVPRCAPLINGGFIAIRASHGVDAFLESWERDVRDSGRRRDQPSLRRLLYQSDLRFLALGHEYNMKWLPALEVWRGTLGAPRVLHCSSLHQAPEGDPLTPLTLKEGLGSDRATHVQRLLEADWSLGGDGKNVRPRTHDSKGVVRLYADKIRRRLRRALRLA